MVLSAPHPLSRRLFVCVALLVAPSASAKINVCPEAPELVCTNGSHCLPGDAVIDEAHEHLDIVLHQDGYHCECPPGFIGNICEIPVEECNDNAIGEGGINWGDISHSCYHGSKCKTSSVSSRNFCDCDTLNDSTDPKAQKFAGLMCEHKSTAFCALTFVDLDAPSGQFCTNHGACVRMVSSAEPHPGCKCRSGWAGDHCEIESDVFAVLKGAGMDRPHIKEKNRLSEKGKQVFLGLGLFLGSVFILFGIIFVNRRRRKINKADQLRVGTDRSPSNASAVSEADLDADGSSTLPQSPTAFDFDKDNYDEPAVENVDAESENPVAAKDQDDDDFEAEII